MLPWSSFRIHTVSTYGYHVTEKGRMSKLLECVDIVAPGVVLDGEFDFVIDERIRSPGDFYSVIRIC